MSALEHDPVNHPKHYTSRDIEFTCAKCSESAGVECIDITRHFNFNLGNAMKYIWRSESKGEQVQDLKKAAWYIQDEIKKLESVKE